MKRHRHEFTFFDVPGSRGRTRSMARCKICKKVMRGGDAKALLAFRSPVESAVKRAIFSKPGKGYSRTGKFLGRIPWRG